MPDVSCYLKNCSSFDVPLNIFNLLVFAAGCSKLTIRRGQSTTARWYAPAAVLGGPSGPAPLPGIVPGSGAPSAMRCSSATISLASACERLGLEP